MSKEEKQHLRAVLKEKRSQIGDHDHQVLSNRLSEDLIKHPIIQSATLIFGYLSVHKEPDLSLFYQHCLDQKKQLAFPRTDATGSYQFALVSNLGRSLVKGGFGVLEPIPDAAIVSPKERENEQRVMIVPGLAFDKEGYRLGYGKGVYDGLLRDYPVYSIGACYDFQIQKTLPHDSWDERVDLVLEVSGH